MASLPQTLMTLRVPWFRAKKISENPVVRGHFPRMVYATVDEPPEKGMEFSSAHIQGMVSEECPEDSEDFIRDTVRSRGVTHAIISQPLLWYSEIAKKVCSEEGVKVVWLENFPGGKCVLDTIGCQYTKDNEIMRYGDLVRARFPEIPGATPAEQPEYIPKKDALSKYRVTPEKTLVLFGQSHVDMALVEAEGGLKYAEWVEELVRANDDTMILYKPHPVYKIFGHLKDPLSWILDMDHVIEFSDSIFTAFDAFDLFAAYSSTTILEGALQGRFFITGGRHFLDDEGMCVRMTERGRAREALDALRRFKPAWPRIVRRLGFITRSYALNLSSPRLLDKIILSPDEYYEQGIVS